MLLTFEEADEEPLPPAHRARVADNHLLAHGNGNKQIARSLAISEKTVRNHVSNIYKMHVYDRTQAVLHAIRESLVDLKVRRR